MTTDLWNERAQALIDFAEALPEGFVWTEAAEELGLDRSQFYRTVRVVRLALADQGWNLVCDPQEVHEPFLYRLVGTHEDSARWARERLDDSATRLGTIEAVAATVVGVTDGRTADGKKARLIHDTVHFLVGRLAALDGEV